MLKRPSKRSSPGTGRSVLMVGGAFATLASACCLGPLVLITLGVSGAWIGSLAALEPYRPFFIAGSMATLLLAWRRIWRPAGTCAPNQVCASPWGGRIYKGIYVIAVLLLAVALVFPFVAPWFY
jgi:mercuric ion transport protein